MCAAASELRAGGCARGALETEAWHAKRFEMSLVCGVRLPLRARDRAPASAVRAANETCVIHDGSYLRALWLRGAARHVEAVLRATTDVTQSSLDRARRGRREARAMLHAPNRWPEAAIAPVRLLPCPPSADAPSSCEGVDRWWVFVHTAALHPAMAALRAAAADLRADPALDLALEVSATPLPLLRFQLRGARSHALLARALRLDADATPPAPRTSAADSAACSDADAAWRAMGALTSPASLAPRVTLSVRAVHPSRAPHPRAPATAADAVTHAGADGGGGADDDARALAAALRSLLCSWPAELGASGIFEHVHRMDEGTRGGEGGRSEGGVLPLLLIQEPPASSTSAFGSGWDVLVPAGAGRAMWNALVLAGGRAVGQSEVALLAMHRCEENFPRGAPDTAAGAARELADATERAAAHAARPPSRRPNHSALGVAYPFGAEWPAVLGACAASAAEGAAPPPLVVLRGKLASAAIPSTWHVPTGRRDAPPPSQELGPLLPRALFPVSLRLPTRGCARPPAAIYAPTAAALAAWRADASWRGAPAVGAHGWAGPLIGFVSAGGYDQLRGSAAALGFVGAEALLRLEPEPPPARASARASAGVGPMPIFVLVRNSASTRLRPALCRVLLMAQSQ